MRVPTEPAAKCLCASNRQKVILLMSDRHLTCSSTGNWYHLLPWWMGNGLLVPKSVSALYWTFCVLIWNCVRSLIYIAHYIVQRCLTHVQNVQNCFGYLFLPRIRLSFVDWLQCYFVQNCIISHSLRSLLTSPFSLRDAALQTVAYPRFHFGGIYLTKF